jgi:hypothetical protein
MPTYTHPVPEVRQLPPDIMRLELPKRPSLATKSHSLYVHKDERAWNGFQDLVTTATGDFACSGRVRLGTNCFRRLLA